MLRHYINYIDNTYYIEKDDTIVFSVKLDKEDQIEIRTPQEVYAGPIELIGFDPNKNNLTK